MSEQFQKLLQTTDLQIILFNCYEILKGNAGTISLPDLQLEYFIMVGRNLSRIADSYKFDSLAMFLENCPDIKVVYDSETKEIYATIIDGDMTLSSFRNIKRVQVRVFLFIFVLIGYLLIKFRSRRTMHVHLSHPLKPTVQNSLTPVHYC